MSISQYNYQLPGTVWHQGSSLYDTSGNIIPVSGGGSGVSLPVPNVILGELISPGFKLWDGNIPGSETDDSISLYGAPYITAQDLTQSLLDSFDVYVEMVSYHRKSKRSKFSTIKKGGYMVPAPWYTDPGDPRWPSWPNKAKGDSVGFWTRNTTPVQFGINMPNHYRVTSINQKIPVYEYLNGRFRWADVAYAGSNGMEGSLTTTVPATGRTRAGTNRPTNRFSYSPQYTPYRIAFRYVVYDPSSGPINPITGNPYGQIISGPLSRVIVVTQKTFPFSPNYIQSSIIGRPVCDIGGHEPTIYQCYFETKLP